MQEFTKEFKEVLHNKLIIITNRNSLEFLKKIPVHPNLCSVSMNTQMGCLFHKAWALVTVKKINENICQHHAHSESKFSLTSSYEVEVAFIWKQIEIKGSL